METHEFQIEGRNAVLSLLQTDQNIDKLFVQSGAKEGSIQKIIALAREAGVVVQPVGKEKLSQLSQSGSHQGVIALTTPFGYVTPEDILDVARQKNEPHFILLLDGVTDPHNLGAIIRAAEGFGVHGIILPKRRAASVNATVFKTSAGAAQVMKVSRVPNLTAVISQLKKKGIWIYGADMQGSSLYTQSLRGPVALVIGGEGAGLSRLVREHCDFLVSIPMRGMTPSLNASVATGVILSEIMRQQEEPV